MTLPLIIRWNNLIAFIQANLLHVLQALIAQIMATTSSTTDIPLRPLTPKDHRSPMNAEEDVEKAISPNDLVTNADEDVENWGSIKNPSGIPGLAERISQDPDQETYVFRKFAKLTAWNLFFKQTELAGYERQVEVLEARLASHGEDSRMSKRWDIFCKEAQKEGTTANEMSKLSSKISKTLSEYRGSRIHMF